MGAYQHRAFEKEEEEGNCGLVRAICFAICALVFVLRFCLNVLQCELRGRVE